MRLKVNWFETLESTNAYAKELLKRNEIGEGEVIAAASQTQGYGTRGNNWQSPTGNIYFSFILDPKIKNIHISKFHEISFVACVALAKSIQFLIPNLDIKIKWPNDLIINHQKLGGILTEVENEKVILGVGINVFTFPNVENQATTMLANYKNDLPNLPDILHIMLRHIWHSYDNWIKNGFEDIRKEWIKYAYQIGCLTEKNVKKGIFKGINKKGGMILEVSDNQEIELYN